MPGEEKDENTPGRIHEETAMADVEPPILVFLNGASGGRMGSTVMEKMAKLLPEAHIFNLEEAANHEWDPDIKLGLFKDVEGVKVLICGGDGTMGWILSCIDRMPISPDAFPVAMMPLGTGNDLARSFGWGPGFDRSMLRPRFLEKVKAAKTAKLDRWMLSVMPYEPLSDDKKIKAINLPPTFTVHKYASPVDPLTGVNDNSTHSVGRRDSLREERVQSVLRMGRSFSVRMSSIAKLIHEDEMNRSSSQHGRAMERGVSGSAAVLDSIERNSSYRADVTGSMLKSTSGLARASSAPPAVRPSVSYSRLNGGSAAGGGAGASNLTLSGLPLPTVGELNSPVSDVSDSHGGVFGEEGRRNATLAVAGAGAAAMGADDDTAEQDEKRAEAPETTSTQHTDAEHSGAGIASSDAAIPTPTAEMKMETGVGPAVGSDVPPSTEQPLPSAQALQVQAAKPGDPGGSDAATVAREESSTAPGPTAAPASPQKGAGVISGESKDGGVGLAAVAGKVVPLESDGVSSSAAGDAVAPLVTGSDQEPVVLGREISGVPSAAVATAAEDEEGQLAEHGISAAEGGEGVERGVVRHSDGGGVGGVDGINESGSQLRSVVDGQEGAAAGVGELAGGGGGAGGSAVQAAIEQRQIELRQHQQRQEEKRRRHEDALLMMQAATASKGTGNSSSSSSSISGDDLDEVDPPPPQGGRLGPPRAQPSISVTQRFKEWESYDAVFCNYFSFGVDAVAASAFHEHRKKYPQLFTSRCRNQTWYGRKGFPAAGGIPCDSRPPPPFVSQYLDLRMRREAGGEWEHVTIDPGYRGVVILNLQSYGGGRDLWGQSKNGCSSRQFAKAAPDDKLLEVVGVSSIFKLGCIMACNSLGSRAHRLCQAAELELRVRLPIHMQIDGEPWLQAPAKINIQHYAQSTCLRGKK